MSGAPVPEWIFSPVTWITMAIVATVVVGAVLWLTVKVARAIWRGWR